MRKIPKGQPHVNKRKVLHGVAVNDADYAVSWLDGAGKKCICPIYDLWNSVIYRALSEKYNSKFTLYNNVTICDEWLRFSNFKHWLEQQDYRGKCIDKDLLSVDSKIYSPETCALISHKLNTFISDNYSPKGKYHTGTYYDKNRSKWRSQGHYYNKRSAKHLGYYRTREEAHEAYRCYKEYGAIQLAELETDERIKEALIERYSFNKWYDPENIPNFKFVFENNKFKRV